jgi:endonuclease-3
VDSVLAVLQKQYSHARCSLNYDTPFQLLCATILSAQCTDERVNMVTPALFARYPTAHALAKAQLGDVEHIIKSTGFYKNKARSLVECAQSLVEKYQGEVPRLLEELVPLRGVGRKTANVVLGNAYGVPAMVVDTHVGRLSRRLGFTKHTDPVKVEQDLMKIIPQEHWTIYSHWLIYHGRARCMARNPNCSQCELAQLCPKVGVSGSKQERTAKKASHTSSQETAPQKASSKKAMLALSLALALPLISGCQSLKFGTYARDMDAQTLSQDRHMAFAPHRLWRLQQSWRATAVGSPYAFVRRDFRYIAYTTAEKKKLQELIGRFTKNDDFYLWLESRIEPLDLRYQRIGASLFTDGGAEGVLLSYESKEPIKRDGRFTIDALNFPDPLLQRAQRKCLDEGLDVEPSGQAMGVELVLETNAAAMGTSGAAARPETAHTPWPFEEHTPQSAHVRLWSYTGDNQVIYRALFQTTAGHSVCPFPPELTRTLENLMDRFVFNTGITW